MPVSRKTVRAGLYTLLSTGMTIGSAVSASMPARIGATPLTAITSEGSDRPPLTVVGKFTKFNINIINVVRLSDPDSSPPWTPDAAENLLDDMEAVVTGIISANKSYTPSGTTLWNSIEFARPSITSTLEEGGISYRAEIIYLIVEVTRE